MDKIDEEITRLMTLKKELDVLTFNNESQEKLDDNYFSFNYTLKNLKRLYKKEANQVSLYDISDEDRLRRSEHMKKIRYSK